MLYSDANLVKTMGFKLSAGIAPEQLQKQDTVRIVPRESIPLIFLKRSNSVWRI